MSETKAVAKAERPAEKPKTLRDILVAKRSDLSSLLPKGYPVERLVTGALVATIKNPELLKCSGASLVVAISKVAQWGMEIGRTAHLVPFKGICEAIIDYKGIIEMMIAAGARKVEARAVREEEVFDYGYGLDPWLRHQPSRSEKPVIAGYAIVWLKNSVRQFEVVELPDINKRRAMSRNPELAAGKPLPPWYAKKCAVRAIEKYIPKSSPMGVRLRDAIEHDDRMQQFDPETGEVRETRITAGPRVQRLAGPDEYGQDEATVEEEVKQGDAFEESAA